MMVNLVERRIYRSPFSRTCVTLLATVAAALLSVLHPTLQAQQVAPPAGSQAEQKRLLEIRNAALRGAKPQKTQLSNHDIVLERARQDKEFKRRAALAVQQQQSIDAYRKVKQSQIDSWNGKGNSNKISAGVPTDFTTSLPPLDSESQKKKGLFGGIFSSKKKSTKDKSSQRSGFFNKKKNSEPEHTAAQFAPASSLRLDSVAPRNPAPVIASTNQPANEPQPSAKKKGWRMPSFSKLTGGKNKDENPYAYENSNTDEPSPSEPQSDPQTGDDFPEKKKGFFSRLPKIGNKNKDLADNADQYYGPSGEASDSSDQEEWQGADDPEENNKSSFLSKFSLKKDKSKATKKGSSGSIYVIDSDAEFFPFGKSGKQAGAQSLREGTVVRMTKSGDDWSSIELTSGAMGVMRNKHLRIAKADEVPSNLFAHKSKKAFPTTARISKARSATGKKSASAPQRYTEPVTVPLPDLPEGGSEPGALIGNGLLPPLQKPSSIQ
ncbi:MAG: hypothetical protein L3J39_08605 [Verrucomicrobiales bacterium]|nr:hypothetical protein [Verrucomicrobiales bacterium]